MANGYYGGAPNALLGGMEFAAAQRRRRQQENALSSMIRRFGPEAADPVALGQLQGIQQRAEAHPYAMSQLQRADAAQQAAVGQLGPLAGDPAAHGMVTQSQDREMQLRQQAGLRAALFLGAAKQRGANLGEAFDRVSTILPQLGFPAEQIPQIRDQILSNPDSVDELVAMLGGGEGQAAPRAMGAPVPVYDDRTGRARLMQYMSDGSTRIIEGVTPVAALQGESRLQQGWERLGLQRRSLTNEELRMMGYDATPGYQYFMMQNPDGSTRIVADAVPGTAEEATRTQREQEQLGALAESARGLEVVIGDAERVNRWGERALQLMDDSWVSQSNLLSAQARRAAATVPGTTTYEIAQDIENIRGVVAIDELLRIKDRGATLGQVTEKELELLKNKLSTLDVRRDPRLLREDMNEILTMYNDILRRAGSDLQEARQQLQNPPQPQRYGPPVPQPGGGRTAPAPAQPQQPTQQPTPSVDELLDLYAPVQ